MRRASHTLFITQELLPFHATGGMAVLSRDLPEALNREGWQHSTLLPFIEGVSNLPPGTSPEILLERSVRVGSEEYPYRVLVLHRSHHLGDVYLVEQDTLFSGQLYNDAHRLARNVVIGDAALALLERESSDFALVHALDQLSALSLAYIRALTGHRYGLVFNILSAEYDFALGPLIAAIDFDRREEVKRMAGDGLPDMSAIELGMVAGDTTVTSSPAYADELGEKYGNGALAKAELVGINQGIDVAVWDPMASDRLFAPIHVETLEADKLANRMRLEDFLVGQPRFLETSPATDGALSAQHPGQFPPLLSFIGRFCRAKGRAALYLLLDRLKEFPDARLVFVIPKGSLSYVDLKKLEDRAYAEPRLRVINDYDQSFAELVFAASDFVLMPSEQEPGGLCQKMAMRFGTLPLVTPAGGLRTSVTDLWEANNEGNGFVSHTTDPESYLDMLGRVLALSRDDPLLAQGRRQAMATDVSWQKTVADYVAIYETLDRKARSAQLPV
ncbi:MAG: glycogen/starch synthase [Pseudomonadota bacterium]